ncbi:glutamate/aspartate ABC transporter substrate-binding protein [Pseudogulbenkiania subflava]|uniref:Glutamate/aspartate transport system substrate-binding protein n=1 Tax=Pseudogulbenkiania subflava DSM 22618 TaxID=1123014 RepID=A0A1Y6BU84_9NEIS|nr:glutamate/aspartate ABC transporter substrate-binding protein [Pseudogulbenkiania subflava]SMF29060.1 glutamate/aspartate transport system substrate-binding protein [Pseudogulbenkiania subflava DSM 22618]
MRFTTRLICTATVGALLAAPAMSAELTGTLKKIKDSGTIVIGHRDASIPFSYLDNNQQPIGYSMDLAHKVVEAVKKDLKMPGLKVQYNLVTSQTRIPLVQNGTVDIECGSTTNNLERQKQVDFSVGIFEIGTRLLTKKTSGVKDFADLKGKNVVTTAGTTSERLIKSMNAEKQMGMNIISAKDHGESFLMAESGRAVAFMMDDVLLYGEMVKARNPAEWVVTGKPQSFEIYGCMMRKGDPAFKKVVDDAIKATYKSGEINKIYAKWFTSPVPPKNLNLNFPMSDELKALIKNPTDKSAEQM